jgi:hypothetical protein
MRIQVQIIKAKCPHGDRSRCTGSLSLHREMILANESSPKALVRHLDLRLDDRPARGPRADEADAPRGERDAVRGEDDAGGSEIGVEEEVLEVGAGLHEVASGWPRCSSAAQFRPPRRHVHLERAMKSCCYAELLSSKTGR